MICGETHDQNCRNEFENAKRNNDLEFFYKICRTEGGADPMRKTCSLCCNQGNNLIRKTKNSATLKLPLNEIEVSNTPIFCSHKSKIQSSMLRTFSVIGKE